MHAEFIFGSDKTFFKVEKDAIQVHLTSVVLGDRNRLEILDNITFVEEFPDKIFFGNNEVTGGFYMAELNENLPASSLVIYSSILEKSRDYHLCRAWNYIPRINTLLNEKLIYGMFNEGRSLAFHNFFGEQPFHPPAATGIDILGDKVVIGFLATKNPVSYLSNPLQTDSFHYPEKFGKRPPCFSRATKTLISGKDIVFVSGTASIRGSESIHPGDILKQTEITIENIEIMLREAGLSKWGNEPENYHFEKIIYVKHPEQLGEIMEYIREHHPVFSGGIVLHANVCRKDLDIEICATAIRRI